ncbi:MAG: DUF2693 domain-containing protein [Saprospiraceae bacterium]|nr:DUF2693 domain-containing protein [Saprospiraceae bacterium]
MRLHGQNHRIKPKPEVIKYFDIEAQSFRSFRIDRFIGLVA